MDYGADVIGSGRGEHLMAGGAVERAAPYAGAAGDDILVPRSGRLRSCAGAWPCVALAPDPKSMP